MPTTYVSTEKQTWVRVAIKDQEGFNKTFFVYNTDGDKVYQALTQAFGSETKTRRTRKTEESREPVAA